MYMMGRIRRLERDYETTLKYLTKAAELGDAGAHYHLSLMYRDGEGVEKDQEKEIYHLEEAAIGGHPNARFNVGCIEQWQVREGKEAFHHRRQPRASSFTDNSQATLRRWICEQRRLCQCSSFISGCRGCNEKFRKGESRSTCVSSVVFIIYDVNTIQHWIQHSNVTEVGIKVPILHACLLITTSRKVIQNQFGPTKISSITLSHLSGFAIFVIVFIFT